jgi:hypothetical protein
MFLYNLKIIPISLLALAALATIIGSQAAAEELPPLVAKLYPGAVAGTTDEGKIIQCGGNQVDYHKPYCFLTKDSIDKVREYYARAGIKLEPVPVKRGQNTQGDSLDNLAEAASLQLNREVIGSIYAAPVEYVQTHSAADEPSYFNTVIVISGKSKQKLQGSAQANRAAILEDPIFGTFALTPESAPSMIAGLMVDPELLIPLYNKHIALQGSFFTMEGSSSWFEINHKKLGVKRMTDRFAEQLKENREKSDQRKAERKNMTLEMRMQQRAERAVEREKKREQRDADRKNNVVRKAAPAVTEDWGPEADRAKVIDAFLDEMEKEAYPTMIMIQRAGKSGVTRNPAVMLKAWRTALAPL